MPLVNATWRSVSMSRCSSGVGYRRSWRTNSASTTVATSSSPSPRTLVQPQPGANEMASRTGVRPSARSAAPTTSRPRSFEPLDLGVQARTAASETTAETAPIPNTQRKFAWSVITPPRVSPIADPPPTIAPTRASPRSTWSGGAVSRTSANESGTIAAPTPLRMRPSTITGSDGASAHSKPPRAKRPRTATITCCRPHMSAMRPIGPTVTPPARKNALASVVAPTGVVSKCMAIRGSAGISIVWASTNEPVAADTANSVSPTRTPDVSAPTSSCGGAVTRAWCPEGRARQLDGSRAAPLASATSALRSTAKPSNPFVRALSQRAL